MSAAEVILPQSEAQWLSLRSENVNSTESAAFFGVCPYLTTFELYHRRHDKFEVPFESNDRVKWGKRLQDAIARGVAEDQGWGDAEPMPEYVHLPEKRMGASFDWKLGKEGLLEIKCVDGLQFRDGWIVDGNEVEAPPHIEIQVQHQLAVSGRSFAHIAALVGGNQIVLIRRERNESVIRNLFSKAEWFWSLVDAHTPPAPDFAIDADFISKLYGYSEEGKVLDASQDSDISILAGEHRAWGIEKKKAEVQQDALKAQLLMKIGSAEKVLGSGFSISAGTVAGGSVAYERKPYRGFRVNWKKEKKDA